MVEEMVMGFIFFAVNLVFNFYREKHQTPNTKHQTFFPLLQKIEVCPSNFI
jgi:hypothetical protein